MNSPEPREHDSEELEGESPQTADPIPCQTPPEPTPEEVDADTARRMQWKQEISERKEVIEHEREWAETCVDDHDVPSEAPPADHDSEPEMAPLSPEGPAVAEEEPEPAPHAAPVHAERPRRTPRRRVILLMTVDIGDGRMETIKVHNDDSPLDLARVFCQEHQLAPGIITPLTHHIFNNIKKLPEHKRHGFRMEEMTDEEIQLALAAPLHAEEEEAPEVPDELSSPHTHTHTHTHTEPEGEEELPAEGDVEDEEASPGYARHTHTHTHTPHRHRKGHKRRSHTHAHAHAHRRHAPLSDEEAEGVSPDEASPPHHPHRHLLSGVLDVERPRSASVHKSRSASPLKMAQRPNSAQRSRLTPHERTDYYDHMSKKLPQHLAGRLRDQRRDTERSAAQPATPKIDKRSRRIAGVRQSGVFERLHSQAAERQRRLEDMQVQTNHARTKNVHSQRVSMSAVSRQMTKGRNKSQYSNYCERLYKEGLDLKRQREAKAAKERALRDQDPEATFKPKISSRARQIRREGDEAWQRVIDSMGTIRKQAEERRVQERNKQMSEGCTFKPDISTRSRKIAQNRLRQSTATRTLTDRLYGDAERRKMRLEEYSNWFPEEHTFHPEVHSAHPQAGTNFVDRLYSAHAKKEEHLAELRAQHHQNIDPETGRPLFHPQTGRAPNFRRNTRTLPIGDFLFNSRFELQEAKEQLRDLEAQRTRELSNMSFTHENSLRLLEEIKQRKYRAIFDQFDADHKGVIDVQAAIQMGPQLAQLDPMLEAEIIPILNLCTRATLAFDEFVQHVETTLREQKWPHPSLLDITRRPSDSPREHDELTFRPALNKKTQRLAARRRNTAVPLHEMLIQESQKWDEKNTQRRKQLERERMSECTFEPKLVTQPASPKKIDAGEVTRRLTQPPTKRRPGEEALTSDEIALSMCTFHPEINSSSLRLVRRGSDGASIYSSQSHGESFSPDPYARAGPQGHPLPPPAFASEEALQGMAGLSMGGEEAPSYSPEGVLEPAPPGTYGAQEAW